MSIHSASSPLSVFWRTVLWANSAGVVQLQLDDMMPPPVIAYIELPQRLEVMIAAFILPTVWYVARMFWVGGATKGTVSLAAVIFTWLWVYSFFGQKIVMMFDSVNIL
jgi:hypothetical protein